MQSPGVTDFLLSNLILIIGVGLLIFIYFIFLLRKRWKNNFLHPQPKKPDPKDVEGG